MQHSRKMKYPKQMQQTSEYDKKKKKEAGSQREQTSGYL